MVRRALRRRLSGSWADAEFFRQRTPVEILYWKGSVLWVLGKRLEKDFFQLGFYGEKSLPIP